MNTLDRKATKEDIIRAVNSLVELVNALTATASTHKDVLKALDDDIQMICDAVFDQVATPESARYDS